MGALNCEWCELGQDGETPLQQPFCASQRVCFAGVLGARTPYDDEINQLAGTVLYVGDEVVAAG